MKGRTSHHVLIGLLIAIGLLMVLEGLARVLGTVYNDVRAYKVDSSQWLLYSEKFGWEKRPNFSGLMPNETRTLAPEKYQRQFDEEGFLSVDAEQIRHGRHRKILAIGDSNTFGWGVPTDMTFVEVLDELLSETDVINLGVTGYSSFQGRKVLESVFDRFQPALVIVSFNFNDRRFVTDAAEEDAESKFSRDTLMRNVDGVRDKIYLYRMIELAATKLGLGQGVPRGTGGWDVRRMHARVPPAQYRENLERIARFCQERGVPLVFIVLQDNPVQTAQLRSGVELFRRGELDGAERDFRIVVRSNGWFTTLGKKYLADLYERQGKAQLAEVVAREGSEILSTGDKPIFLDSEYNEIMRAVGLEYGVSLVEAGEALKSDPSVYVDFCHFDERGHRTTALMLKEVVEHLLPTPEVSR